MDKPKAFVIMPFAEGFDVIYSAFLYPTLEEAGFNVHRADEIRSTQNILKDIVQGIGESDIIVADLTDSNPNVYYELGIAHTLNKRVIMLSQSIEELPFDLRSYRVIPYTTHFSDIEKAKTELSELAKGLISGVIPFSGPVVDFLQPISERPKEASIVHDPDKGPLDYMGEFEEGMEDLTQILSENNSAMLKINDLTVQVTGRLNNMQSSPGTFSAREARTLVGGLAIEYSKFSDSLSKRNDRYYLTLSKTKTALEWIAQAQDPQSDEQREKLVQLRDVLQETKITFEEGIKTSDELIQTFKNIPPSERTFQRAQSKVIHELGRWRNNFQQTVSMSVRAIDILNTRLS